jgi:hypothetical protein
MKLLKPYHEITLKDVILLDATKSANVLKKYWFIPLFLCRNELEQLATKIFESIGGKTVNDLQDQFDRITSYRRLLILEALYKAVQIEFELKGRVTAWKVLLGKDFKESPQLEQVMAEVLKHTGISIETPESLKDFADYVQFRIDKHAETYPEIEEEEKESTPLIEVFNSVFLFFNLPPNENALLITWIALKKQAEERIRSQKPEENELQ